MSATIEVRGVSKAFAKVQALDNVSFKADPGHIVGLIGPNGAGKTTALRAILGLTPYQGELKVLGLDPYTQRDRLMQDVCFIADVPCCRGGSACTRRCNSSRACTRASGPSGPRNS